MNTLAWAKYYRSLGWSVIPLSPGSKIPPKDFSPIPYRERYATDQELEAWFGGGNNNIGIVTGKLSKLLVIDLDRAKPEYSEENTIQYIGDSIETPMVSTPSGGLHIYYKYPDGKNVTIGSNLLPATDFRGEGGYVVAPPSVNGKPNAYAWVLDVKDTSIKDLNTNLLYKLLNTSTGIYTNSNNHANKDEHDSNALTFDRGNRDSSLFHVANSLIRGGMTDANARRVLEILANNCKPPFSPEETKIKIESALSRKEKRTIGLKEDIEEFISVSEGVFSVSDLRQGVSSVSRADGGAVRKVLQRLKQAGIIEKVGSKDGVYQRVIRNYEVMDWLNAPTNDFHVNLPLGISDMVKIYPGNIIVVAGASNAGKTAFLLNVVKENMSHYPIYYMNSEMGPTEMRMRLGLFDDVPLKSWRFTPIERSSEHHQIVDAEKAIYIIDYLEISDNFYLVSGMIRQIHEKLKEGICIIALQKKSGSDIGRGGEGTLEKPRLYVSLDKDDQSNIAKIVKAKAWRDHGNNPNGKTIRYKLINGSNIKPISDWR
jgi:hypothetical protein